MILPIEKLAGKYDVYLNLIKKKQDKSGFILTEKCDSLLFSGLIGSLPELDVDITEAYNRSTRLWKRRPLYYEPCYPNHSKSTISRDMLLGLAWYSWFNKRKDIADNIIKTTFEHWGIVGKQKSLEGLSRVIMSPTLLSTFAWISYKLGGPSRPLLRFPPAIVGYKLEGYRAHLAVLHALLRIKIQKVDTGLPIMHNFYYKAFDYHQKRQPQNPLYAAASCNNALAIDILLDETLWPSDRLPTTLDRKSSWLLQKDYGDSWKPEKSWVEHTGGDFLFAAALVLNKI